MLQIPTNKNFKSINLSHSLTIICYELFKQINSIQFEKTKKTIKVASKKNMGQLINHLKKLLDEKNFFTPIEKRHAMMVNINNLFYRFEPSDKELRILASIISTLAKKNSKLN